MNKVVSLHPKNVPTANFVRIGATAHRKLGDWVASNTVRIQRAVFDASQVAKQTELLNVLKNAGAELVLDPKTAELGTVGGAATGARNLPWAPDEDFWLPRNLTRRVIEQHVNQIAEFAVDYGFDAVWAGTHFLDGHGENWLAKDLESCERLRHALDRSGGKSIALDYPIIIQQKRLDDQRFLKKLAYEIGQLPIDYIWLRAAGFGADATGVAAARYIAAMNIFSALGHPIICDCLGGIMGLAACSIGAASGFAYGVAEKEKFDAGPLKRTSRDRRSGGNSPRIYFPELDLYLSRGQMSSLFDVRGAKSHLICNDRSCCPNGADDMRESSRRHFLIQRHRQIDAFDRVPAHRRSSHVIKTLESGGRTARIIERLSGISNVPDLHRKFAKHNARRDRLAEVLVTLTERQNDYGNPQAPPALNRSRASARFVGGNSL